MWAPVETKWGWIVANDADVIINSTGSSLLHYREVDAQRTADRWERQDAEQRQKEIDNVVERDLGYLGVPDFPYIEPTGRRWFRRGNR